VQDLFSLRIGTVDVSDREKIPSKEADDSERRSFTGLHFFNHVQKLMNAVGLAYKGLAMFSADRRQRLLSSKC
jgi:hypothetical protein